MRVGVVCPYGLDAAGGVQSQVIGLADALRREGHDVTIISPVDGCAPVEGVIGVGRSISFRVNGSNAPMAPHPAALAGTAAVLRRERFDVVHLHEPLAPSITIAALLTRPAPLVGTFHAAGDRTPYRWCGPPLRRLARRVDLRVAVSPEARRLAQRRLGGTYELLPNGIDLGRYARPPSVESADPPAVLFLGRHEPRKGLDVLLEAFDRPGVAAQLWIAGQGPDTDRLRRRWAGRVGISWLGRLDEAEKIDRLHRAAVLCVPSLHGESFGVVLLEAMAAGTPIVASDLPAYRSLAGDAALLVPAGDPTTLAVGLRRVLGEAGLAPALRARGEATASPFGLDELARAYVSLYERLAEAS